MDDLTKLSDYDFFTAMYGSDDGFYNRRFYYREEYRRKKVLNDWTNYYLQCFFGRIETNLSPKEIRRKLYELKLQKERFSRTRKEALLENQRVDYQICEGTCEYCGRKFRTNLSKKFYTDTGCMKFCSVDCRLAYYKAEGKRKRAEERGKAHCKTCGREFAPRRKGALYCSNKCRQKAYRERSCGIRTTKQS